ncbi:hypothetical protein EON81_19540 [bacterium]|nr:MAG: hypothetical protein EON81_19540 [bacterium]
MKKLAILAFLAVGVASAFAQQPGPRPGGPGAPGGPRRMGMPGQRMTKMNEEIYKQLNLTADQKKKVAALDKSYMEKGKKAFEASKGDFRAMREKTKGMREAHEKALFVILTDPQEKKYKSLRKAQMEKMRKQFGGMRGGPGAPPKP